MEVAALKLISCTLTNFGSYKELTFNYTQLGLCLIYGSTGAGKSTLMDASCWCLFGITAKNGSVDEVRNWEDTNTPTKGVLQITIRNETIKVTRIRGKQVENDLYWETEDGAIHRGKDIINTQLLLESKLGVTAEMYCAASYYSEFSPSASFFTSPAKAKRALLENVADLEFAVMLSLKVAEAKKKAKAKLLKAQSELDLSANTIEANRRHLQYTIEQAEDWDFRQEETKKRLLSKALNFEQDKEARLEKLAVASKEFSQAMINTICSLQETISTCTSGTCPTCKKDIDGARKEQLLAQVETVRNQRNPHNDRIESIKAEKNEFHQLRKLEQNKTNPISPMLEKLCKDIELQADLHETLIKSHAESKYYYDSVNQLSDLISGLRGSLLTNSVERIQNTTNDYLNRFFDSEFTLSAELSADDVNVTLFKDGYECNFKQLSKGQRGLLKLTFALAVMKEASNKSGSHFSTVFLDESLDGLDTDLKVKAFNLFSELELNHESVLVIDHALELKSLFTNKLEVILTSEGSNIHEKS